jgi:phospholipid/cholesterol/gamma-HCH transport system permease protein
MKKDAVHPAEMAVDLSTAGNARLRLSGTWCVDSRIPSVEDIEHQLSTTGRIDTFAFDTTAMTGWDSGLLVFLKDLKKRLGDTGITIDNSGLPDGVRKILAIAEAVPEKMDAGTAAARASFLTRVGEEATAFWAGVMEMLTFIGEAVVGMVRLLAGKARFRRVDFIGLLRECGANALPIVSMISLLVGLILAFVGAIQLLMFGAQIYVANLVGIAMVRVLGAVMTGIIMSGRTGAAFAAQLGTMQVNEELDALETLGIAPMDFLVIPRMLALTLMMPLLCLYADLMGVLGGLIVGVTMLDISLVEYWNQTVAAIGLNHLWVGLFHSFVFGILVALSGCLRGIQCGRSASAVGEATTSAVVTGIVSITVATAVITLLCNIIGI